MTVEISQPSQEPQFDPHKMGGYRSEERAYWEQIYDVDRTLGPLRMVSNRFQISLQARRGLVRAGLGWAGPGGPGYSCPA